MTILAVVGLRDLNGRPFEDFDLLSRELDRYFGWIDEVISGGARGTDRMAVRWATLRGLPYREFKPDVARWGSPLAMFIRNHQIVDECDCLVAFWDGKSSGTRDGVDYAHSKGKPYEIVQL